MSTDYPPVSDTARIQALERLATTLNARIEQISIDMRVSFQQSAAYQEQRFSSLEKQIAEMKGEILGAFNQLLSIIDSRLPPKER